VIETIITIVVATAAICIIIMFAATVRVALANTLREDKKRIAALADEALLMLNGLHVVPVKDKLAEISAIAKNEKYVPQMESAPESSTWKPPNKEVTRD